ncbi:MAG TPA: thioredoxin family protein [Desulfosalsimonadaceae bacterium]|nr:thioredoxin family protein [Desulfosalsimonadaceae bacterium]
MKANDEKTITQWAHRVDAPRPMNVILSSDSRSSQFHDFARQIAELVPALHVTTQQEGEDELPKIQVHPNITYQAVPQGHELEPFLGILSGGGTAAGARHFSDTRVLEKLAMPAVIKVYIAAECPFCPQTVESLAGLAMQQEMIHLFIIDGGMFTELASADKVSSVPTVFLDDKIRWTGSIQIPEVIDMLLNRDPAQLGSETLKQILYDGKAAELAEMMADAGKIFPAFYELLTHVLWPVRLGAMVTVEYLAGSRSDLIREVVGELWRQFDDVEDPVKGDILYLFGETGQTEVRPKLEAVVQGTYSATVKEAASEALAAF